MQRLRETSEGLQFTQELDVITFDPYLGGGIRTRVNRSLLNTGEGQVRIFQIERDNAEDFGKWFAVVEEPNPKTRYLKVNGIMQAAELKSDKRLAAISVRENVQSSEFDGHLEGLIAPDVDEVGGLGIPVDYRTIMIVTQDYDRLTLDYRGLFGYDRIPIDVANQFGGWVLNNLEAIEKPKSIWG